MKLCKTDRRFKLRGFGFDCYLEFDDLREYVHYQKHCRDIFGEQFFLLGKRVYQEGKYHFELYRYRNGVRVRRIYLKDEKHLTLLMMTMPSYVES